MGRFNNRYKRDMKTAVEWLESEIHFIENNRMQSIYTIEVYRYYERLNFKLAMEKEQNDKAYEQGGKDAWDAFYEITKSE
jgi:hypothetical protein